MNDTTDRLGLALLIAGQAQKELFHNEALTALDLAVQASVLAVGADTPPDAPVFGQCWIVGTAPTGAWTGQARSLAGWTGGGWRFLLPTPGMAVWDQASGQTARFDGGEWTVGRIGATRLAVDGVQVVGAQQPGVAAPNGGSTIDAEARAAIVALLAGLRAHGLIAG